MPFRPTSISLCLALALTAAQGWTQEPAARLAHDEAVADAKTFVRLLEDSHPDPYTNLGGKVAFKRRAWELVQAVPPEGLSTEQLASRLGTFIAPLRDGHTSVKLDRDAWRRGGSPLAIRFQIAADGLFIAASDLPQLEGTRGYKVWGVNGRPMPALLQQLAMQVAAENEYGDYRTMVSVLQSRDLLARLLPDMDLSRGITFNLQTPGGARVDRTVAPGGEHDADPAKWREKPRRWAGLERSDEMFYYRFLGNGRTAYLRVSSMGGREGFEILQGVGRGKADELRPYLEEIYQKRGVSVPADWSEAIRGLPSVVDTATRMLQEMKQRETPNLIIDIRGNGGGATGVIVPVFYEMHGDDYFAQDFPHESVTVMSQIYLDAYHMTVAQAREKDPDFELGQYRFDDGSDEQDASARSGTERAMRRREAKIAQWKRWGLTVAGQMEALGGKPLYRPKNVVVLCDATTFSAAFQMAFYLHRMGATLVGVPSAQSPNTYMEVTPYTLPRSSLTGSISNSTQVFLPQTPAARVLPVDFAATYSVFKRYDFDEETSLRYALDLLAKGKI